MKFIAILKDSLRETLDVKLFYVTVAISVLTLVLVCSIVYKPVPIDKQLGFITTLQNAALRQQMQQRTNGRVRLQVEFENIERLDDRKEPWLGDYRFDYVIAWSVGTEGAPPTAEEKKLVGSLKTDLKDQLSKDTLERGLRRIFREVKVSDAQARKDLPPGSEELRFRVETKGTKITNRRDWAHEPRLFFGAVGFPIPVFTMSQIIDFIANQVIGAFGAGIALLLSTILTASFLPGMLAKGTVDLLIVKPIHRSTLFAYKFVGGLLFMFLNTAVIMGGLWLVIGLQTGTWLTSLLACIPIFTFQFAIFYSVMAVVAVWTRSTIVCILLALLTWVVLFTLGWAHYGLVESRRDDPEYNEHWAFIAFDAVNTASPRYKELDWLTSKLIKTELANVSSRDAAGSGEMSAEEQELRKRFAEERYKEQMKAIEKDYGRYSWASSLTVTSLFIAVMLGFACWRFSVKDY